MKLHGSRPEAENLRAVMFDDLLGLDRVAERLVHRAAFAIKRPTAKGAGTIGRCAAQSHSNQQRALKPAAVLVAPFQVQVCRPRQAVLRHEHGKMARTGIKPHVENVAFFRELRPAASRTRSAGGQQFGGAALVPDIGGLLSEELHNPIENLTVCNQLAARLAMESDDGHTPDAL